MATPDKALSLRGMFRPAAACSVFVGIGQHQNQSSMLSVEVQTRRLLAHLRSDGAGGGEMAAELS